MKWKAYHKKILSVILQKVVDMKNITVDFLESLSQITFSCDSFTDIVFMWKHYHWYLLHTLWLSMRFFRHKKNYRSLLMTFSYNKISLITILKRRGQQWWFLYRILYWYFYWNTDIFLVSNVPSFGWFLLETLLSVIIITFEMKAGEEVYVCWFPRLFVHLLLELNIEFPSAHTSIY